MIVGESEWRRPMTHGPLPRAADVDNTCANDDICSNKSFDSASTSTTDGRWILRGVQWRIRLGVLPASPASIDTLRRVSADGRRRYADLRRRLLVDPHIIEEGRKPAHVNVDNPLSLDPESVWGRYFRNAELERTIEKDLTRLYPEHCSFFQSSRCQAMLRRILLVWSLMHPQYSYRQGMHELLAPLLYVLHIDVIYLAQVRNSYEDLFDDRFDGLPIHESNMTHKGNKGRKLTYSEILFDKSLGISDEGHWVERISAQYVIGVLCQAGEGDTDLKAIVLGSDLYGAEGELGALLSARFVEHDAYCMFDALLGGQGGAVAMADYFSNPSGVNLPSGIPPVLEASAALYRALAAVDITLYSHLVNIGVEPQFFALRWLRLLFGREFILEDLLLLWDAIFSATNIPLSSEDYEDNLCVKYSPRSALISALAMSMLLYMRPALLAAPDATGCLQRLLNFPRILDVKQLIESAKALQPLAQSAARMPPPHISRVNRAFDHSRIGKHMRAGSVSPPLSQGHVAAMKNSSLRTTACSPELLRMSLPESYWEDKWTSSVLQNAKETIGSPTLECPGKQTPASQSAESDHETPALKSSVKESAADASLMMASTLSETERILNVASREKDCLMSGGMQDNEYVLMKATIPVEQAVSLQTSRDLGQWSLNEDSEAACLSPEKASPAKSLDIVQRTFMKTADPNLCLVKNGAKDGAVCSSESSLTSGNWYPIDSQVFLNGEPKASAAKRVSPQVHLPIREDCVDNARESSNMADSAEKLDQSFLQHQSELIKSDETTMKSGSTATTLPLFSLTAQTTKLAGQNIQGTFLQDGSTKSISRVFPQKSDMSCFSLVPNAGSGYVGEDQNLQNKPKDVTGHLVVNSIPFSGQAHDMFSPSEHRSERILTHCNLEEKPMPAKGNMKTRKSHWVWNLASNSGEKSVNLRALKDVGSADEAPGDERIKLSASTISGNDVIRRPKRWWRSNSDVGTVLDYFQDKAGDDNLTDDNYDQPLSEAEASIGSPGLVRRPKEKGYPTSLQALGQSLLEHLQVVEDAFHHENTSKESQLPSPLSRKKGHVAALIALAEIRKIGNVLRQT